jgi:hypothetical protein
MAAVAQPGQHGLTIVIAMVMAVTTINVYWILTTCRAQGTKCFIFNISLRLLASLGSSTIVETEIPQVTQGHDQQCQSLALTLACPAPRSCSHPGLLQHLWPEAFVTQPALTSSCNQSLEEECSGCSLGHDELQPILREKGES